MFKQTRFDGSYEMGVNAEQRFADTLKAHGYTFRRANRTQDIHEHWDFEVDQQKQRAVRFEVKSMKRLRRQDTQAVSDLIYIEFKNVIGLPGWIYGHADYIAFEQPEHFICVNRTGLVYLAERLTAEKIWVNKPTLHKLYRRYDRPDECVTLLKLDEIVQNVPHFTLEAA